MAKLQTYIFALGVAISCAIGLASCGDDPSAVKPPGHKAGPAVTSVWLTDMAEAKRQAGAKKMPILVDFTGSDWCHWCQKLDEEVFDTQVFASWAPRHVILLKIDFPHDVAQSEALKQQNAQLAEQYRVDGFPTILFLDEAGEVIGKTGYIEGGAEGWTSQAEALLKR